MNIKIILLFCLLFMSSSLFAQTGSKTETFKVYGNCGMCKATIEGCLKKKDGVIYKKWDSKAKLLTVTYDTLKISLQQIGKKVSDSGYDNEFFNAPDEKYSKLHSCCQYERPKKS